jgi:hypothetical protein
MYELTVYQEITLGPDDVQTDVLLRQRYETRPTVEDKEDARVAALNGMTIDHRSKVFASLRKIKED